VYAHVLPVRTEDAAGRVSCGTVSHSHLRGGGTASGDPPASDAIEDVRERAPPDRRLDSTCAISCSMIFSKSSCHFCGTGAERTIITRRGQPTHQAVSRTLHTVYRMLASPNSALAYSTTAVRATNRLAGKKQLRRELTSADGATADTASLSLSFLSLSATPAPPAKPPRGLP
jgi:hypothetical protein